eukprot:TRINITY_DN3334_c0_g1_i1.p1 TRINITY_DN3334_c0_g1~~TRINITY_DN3334_c0_g1_i1.p1  ORF type:complete len:305 (+),score=40.40 TRINITY_DN3334_c0_g1_i1:299-1213(+)
MNRLGPRTGMLRRSPTVLIIIPGISGHVGYIPTLHGFWRYKRMGAARMHSAPEQEVEFPWMTPPWKRDTFNDPRTVAAVVKHAPQHPLARFHIMEPGLDRTSWYFYPYRPPARPWWMNWQTIFYGYWRMFVTLLFIYVMGGSFWNHWISRHNGIVAVPSPIRIMYGMDYYTYCLELRQFIHNLGYPLTWMWWVDFWHPWDLDKDLREQFGEPIPYDKRTKLSCGDRDTRNNTLPPVSDGYRCAPTYLTYDELGIDYVPVRKEAIKPHPTLGPHGLDNVVGRNHGLHPTQVPRGETTRTPADKLG